MNPVKINVAMITIPVVGMLSYVVFILSHAAVFAYRTKLEDLAKLTYQAVVTHPFEFPRWSFFWKLALLFSYLSLVYTELLALHTNEGRFHVPDII